MFTFTLLCSCYPHPWDGSNRVVLREVTSTVQHTSVEWGLVPSCCYVPHLHPLPTQCAQHCFCVLPVHQRDWHLSLLSQELCDPSARLVAFTFLEVGLEKTLVQLGFYLSMHVYVNSAYDSGWRKMAATQLSVFGQGEGSEAWSSQSNQRLVYPSFLCLVQVKQETTQGKHMGLAIFCSPSPWCRLASKAVGGNNSVQPFQCLFTDLLSINPFWPRSSHLLSPLLVEG